MGKGIETLDVLDLSLHSNKYRELIFAPFEIYKHIYYVSILDLVLERCSWVKWDARVYS